METVLANILGGYDPLIVLVVVLVLFGGSQLPKFAKGLGQAKHEFEKAQKAQTPADDATETKPEL